MLRPPPQLTVSEWAERHRMLGSRASAEPGPWRTSRTPYLKDVMDALSAVHPARRVVFMKGAQTGGSEAGNNWLGYIVHHVPAPVLAVQPTVELAKRFSRQRIDPLLEETPALRERVAPSRARDSGNTMLSKEFPGGILVLTGANSAVGLRSMTARFVFLDEVDAYPGDVAGEGDPIALADAAEWPLGWVHLPQAIEVEWVKQLVAEQLRTSKDKRGFARQEWAKLRDRNEALDCAVLARAALWLLGADRYGERFWQRLRDEVANAPMMAPTPTPPVTPNTPGPTSPPVTPNTPGPTSPPVSDGVRPRSWLASRGGWLR